MYGARRACRRQRLAHSRPQTAPARPIPIAIAIAAAVAACESDASLQADVVIATDSIGDTIVVRALSGGAWDGIGELVPDLTIGQGVDAREEYTFGRIASLAADDDGNIYVLDGQAQELRLFDAEGSYVRTLARRGRGPRELAGADAIALLPDRRVVVRDPANGRVQVIGSEAGRSAEWRHRTAVTLSYTPLWTDGRGRTYLVAPDSSDAPDRGERVVVLGPRGEALETFAVPGAEFAPAVLEARRTEGPILSSTGMAVPFGPTASWAVHPTGAILVGVSSEYRIEVRTANRVRRIERLREPVPVSPAERDYHREFIERNMRNFGAVTRSWGMVLRSSKS